MVILLHFCNRDVFVAYMLPLTAKTQLTFSISVNKWSRDLSGRSCSVPGHPSASRSFRMQGLKAPSWCHGGSITTHTMGVDVIDKTVGGETLRCRTTGLSRFLDAPSSLIHSETPHQYSTKRSFQNTIEAFQKPVFLNSVRYDFTVKMAPKLSSALV